MILAVPVRRLAHAVDLPLPEYQTDAAAGLDLRAANPHDAPIVIDPLARALIPIGLALQLPPGYEAQIRPRSGLAVSYGVTVLNAPGTVDSDYRGEIQVLLVNLGAKPFVVTRGLRVAQLVIAPVLRVVLCETEALDPTGRADGGFGSTGA